MNNKKKRQWLLSKAQPVTAELSTSEASASWLEGEAMLCQHTPFLASCTP